jgi:hypothetical protein
MRALSVAVLTALSFALAAPAFALGPVHSLESPRYVEQTKTKFKSQSGGCKYEYKADKKGFKEKLKCK